MASPDHVSQVPAQAPGDGSRGKDPVVVERHGRVAVVTLNRPERHNAVDGATLQALGQVFELLAEDDSVRALLLGGEGRSFCAGADVHDDYYEAGPEAQAARVALGYDVARRLRGLPFPTVCAIQGACVAIGVSLAALCDLRVASSDARFILGFAQIGIVPDLCASTLLPSLLGPSRAMELVLLDEPLEAERALQAGLVTRIVAPEAFTSAGLELADRLAARSGAATRQTRELLRDLPALAFGEASRREEALVAGLIGARDVQEGIAAARERRAPVFTTR